MDGNLGALAMRRLTEMISIVVGIALLCGAAYSAGYAHRGYIEEKLQSRERDAAKFRIEWGEKE